jgi:hypothetical protein
MTYTFDQAIEIVRDIQDDMGEGLLETLQYMDGHIEQFEDRQQTAFRVVMREMRKLFR